MAVAPGLASTGRVTPARVPAGLPVRLGRRGQAVSGVLSRAGPAGNPQGARLPDGAVVGKRDAVPHMMAASVAAWHAHSSCLSPTDAQRRRRVSDDSCASRGAGRAASRDERQTEQGRRCHDPRRSSHEQHRGVSRPEPRASSSHPRNGTHRSRPRGHSARRGRSGYESPRPAAARSIRGRAPVVGSGLLGGSCWIRPQTRRVSAA